MDEGKLSKAEQEALKERTAELRASKGRKRKTREDAQVEVLEKISEMAKEDKSIALGIHEIVMNEFEQLWPRLCYGMPAYSLDGKVLLFLSVASKWGTRYATLSFEDKANLHDGEMWPTGFAIRSWNKTVENRTRELISRAISGANPRSKIFHGYPLAKHSQSSERAQARESICLTQWRLSSA
jgi:uncharacterized protein YdhG (YjbR/CyaY superfamily)